MKFNIYLSKNTSNLVELSSQLIDDAIFFPETARHANELIQDLFVKNQFDLQKVNNIITHSNDLVNYFGHLIAENKLSNTDINVFIVERYNNLLYFKCSRFDTEGYLVKFPLGFLDIDVNLLCKPIINYEKS